MQYILGPLHTRAKSHDHEIVRAQKKASKGHLKTPLKSCSVFTNLQVWHRGVICDRARQLNAIPMNDYAHMSSHMIKWNKSINVSIRSAMVSQFCVRLPFKKWFLEVVQVTMKHYPFDVM
jgi:hypothetical protein